MKYAAALYVLMWLVPINIAFAQECQTRAEGMFTLELCQQGEGVWPEFHDLNTTVRGYQYFMAANVGLTYYSKLGKDRPGLLQIAIGYFGEQPKTFDVTIHGFVNFKPEGDLIWTMGDQSGEAVIDGEGVRANGVTMTKGQTAGLSITAKPTKPPIGDWKLVYTQQRRHTTEICGDFCIDDASYAQTTTDVGKFKTQSESNVVIDDLKGNRKVLFNCDDDPHVICAALEARVSPSGRYIAFPVVYAATNGPQSKRVVLPGNGPVNGSWPEKAEGDLMLRQNPKTEQWYPLPWEFDAHRGKIVIHDLANGEQWTALDDGNVNRMVEWASNDLLLVTSDKAGTYAPLSRNNDNFYPAEAFHLWRWRVDFAGKRLVEPKDLTPGEFNVMAPLVMSSGWVCYSGLEGVQPRDFGSTPQNHWWPKCVDINGNGIFVELGAHGSGSFKGYEYVKDWVDPNRTGQKDLSFDVLALAGMGEIFRDYLSVGIYYRSNHQGRMGAIGGFGFTPGEPEGALRESQIGDAIKFSAQHVAGSGRYVPPDFKDLTPFAMSQDIDVRFDKRGRAAGKAGYPAQWWGGKWIYTRGRGGCYTPGWPWMRTSEDMGGEPLCLKQINIAHVRQITNPWDTAQTELLACGGLDEHCWDARPIGQYGAFYGVEAPQIAEVVPDPTECFLNVVDARRAEIHPIPGKTGQQDRIDFQGNADPLYSTKVTHFKVVPFEHWPTLPTRGGLYRTGEPILAPLEADGSVRVRVPCGTPLKHFGWDGKEDIAAANSPIATYGELTCHGCHDGHSTERFEQFGGKSARERFKDTIAGRKL